MTEKEWVNFVTEMLDKALKDYNPQLSVDAGEKLVYANEIIEYTDDVPQYKQKLYETDFLISEWTSETTWKPRVIIEAKVCGVTTHDAITYSKKSEQHKAVHPYLRYGICIGSLGSNHLPSRLFRHGESFDFMMSWEHFEPSKTEWDAFVQVIISEVEASKTLESIIFDSYAKERNRVSVFHRPLVIK